MPDRVLILANEFIADAEHTLPEEVRREEDQTRELLVVAPMLTTRLESLTSDTDGARIAAEQRLGRIAADISRMRGMPRTEVGAEDQLLAVADALHGFDADSCVVVTHDRHSASYHEREIGPRIHRRFNLPTTVLTVDREGRIVGHETL